MLYPVLLRAQFEPTPTFTLAAPDPPCVDAEQHYTCSTTGNAVTLQIPNNVDLHGCQPGQNCHFEYCFSASPPLSGLDQYGTIPPGACNWTHPVPSTLNLPNLGNQTYSVYGEYRLVYSGTSYPSTAATYPMTLNNGIYPTVALNSPAGLPNGACDGTGTGSLCNGGWQFQQLNIDNEQPVAYNAASTAAPSETVNVTVFGCTTSGCETNNPLVSYLDTPPYTWWWSGATANEYAYLNLTATDQAGNQTTTNYSTPVLSLFDPSSTGTQYLNCGPPGQSGTQPCLLLADAMGSGDDIAGDTANCNPNNGYVFCGYADPSMRVDSIIDTSANPWGTNLWMTYSSPLLNSNSYSVTGVIPSVEVHLASSSTGGMDPTPGGLNWTAWCDSCDSYTPLYPSVKFGSGSGTYYSSHEVSNIWECPTDSCSTETWYAAHLMYFVYASDPYINDSLSDGCLVVSYAQAAPNNLYWPTSGPQPSSCTDTANLPSGSNYVWFSDLDTLTGNSSDTCVSWGEPAIMVTKAFAGTPTLYLAVSCIESDFQSAGYYILSTTSLNLAWTPGSQSFQDDWQVVTSFDYTGLTSLSGLPYYANLNSISEFDWFLRPDSTLVAVLSPEYVTAAGLTQYGCLAVNFDMNAGSNDPFTGIIASVEDYYGSLGSGWYEPYPAGCTYEANSNTGMAIVRAVLNQDANKAQKEYSIVSTGLFP
jgi:hypothetical protein